MEQERIIELCEAYPPVSKIVEIKGQGADNYVMYALCEFLIQLTSDLEANGMLPMRPDSASTAQEVPDVGVAQ